MRLPGWPYDGSTAFKEAASQDFAAQCHCRQHAVNGSSAVACRMPSSTAVVFPASGTCPTCGYFNHPDANVRAADDGWIYCVNCGESWRTEACP